MHLAESAVDLDLTITASLCLNFQAFSQQENKQRFDLYNFDNNKQNI